MLAQESPKVTLDTSETLFTVLAAMNACGYDSELALSDPLREQIRGEVAAASQSSVLAKETTKAMCQFYDDHKQPETTRTLAQYVSLALYLNPPPGLTTKSRITDLPPDASYVANILPLLHDFYTQAGLHAIWERHRDGYSALTTRYHEALASSIFDAEVYLKLPSQGYLGRGFTVYLEPLGAPGPTNARNYGSEYYVVISPGVGTSLKMEQIRHTYLHFLLDPFALKYPSAIKRLEPLLDSVKFSPMDESFKEDISLLVTECLIRAIEARMAGSHKAADAERQQAVQQSVEQGFVLTRYFYDALLRFEKDQVSLRNIYQDMISQVDLGKEQKLAAQVKFADTTDPEVLHLSRPAERSLLPLAEQRLAEGKFDEAEKLAQQAIDGKKEDAGRAMFILARVATAENDMDGARTYFQKALGVAREPNVIAWSHLYLGRISDLEDDRAGALTHYQAAITAAASPDVKAAAQRGIDHAYEPHSQSK